MSMSVVSSMAAEQAEKGSGRFVVPRTLLAAGTEIKAGEYDIKWESKASNSQIPTTAVSVEFTPVGKSQGVKVQGKIEMVNAKFSSNNLGIAKDASGRESIKELQYSGKKMKIVFD